MKGKREWTFIFGPKDELPDFERDISRIYEEKFMWGHDHYLEKVGS